MVAYGFYYGSALVAAGLLVAWLASWAWGVPCYILAAFCLYFFRDPDRTAPDGAVAVAPADGKVVAVVSQPAEATRISIFLNIFDVHVNRSPIGGRVKEVRYQPGQFLVASREEASARNEQTTITVEGDGTTVVFKQIAGLIARRIECWKQAGETVARGERIGLIRFGSRMDVFLGPEWEIAVHAGERVSAGTSVIARRRTVSGDPQ
jgi:phosphatidylserine decarboxylase